MAKDREGWVSVEQAAAIMTTTPAELRTLSRLGRLPKIEAGNLPLVKTVQAYVSHLRDPIVTNREAGEHLGISEAMVRKLISDGFIEKAASGGVSIAQSTLGYVRFLREEDRSSRKSTAEAGLKAARQREIEMRIAERENRLVDTEEAIAFVDHIVGRFRAVFGGLPARYTRDIKERRRLEAEVNGGLQQVSGLLAKDAKSLRARGTIDDADTSADA